MGLTITAAIVSHPARWRNGKLQQAIASALAQERQPDEMLVINDIGRHGAGWARQQVLDRVQTDAIAWLDSDDTWYPQHLARLEQVMSETGAAFVFPWFDGHDPLGHFGLPFNPATPHHTTTTYLVRTDLARRAGYVTELPDRSAGVSNEDWWHLLRMCKIAVAEGLLMVHLPERTWTYRADGTNSSGLPWQGDAA